MESHYNLNGKVNVSSFYRAERQAGNEFEENKFLLTWKKENIDKWVKETNENKFSGNYGRGSIITVRRAAIDVLAP
jgi:hypothetical protein